MGSLDTNAKITVLRGALTQAQDLFTQYRQVIGTNAGGITNMEVLTSQQSALKSELNSLTATADTLNTEFEDRMGDAPKGTGISTRQDWILASFFISYAFASLVVIIYILRYSTKKWQGVLIVVIVSVILGIMTAGIIKRLA
jgi:VIT1/CCC1 family predicted Fe2+/Mn2+ transporter